MKKVLRVKEKHLRITPRDSQTTKRSFVGKEKALADIVPSFTDEARSDADNISAILNVNFRPADGFCSTAI